MEGAVGFQEVGEVGFEGVGFGDVEVAEDEEAGLAGAGVSAEGGEDGVVIVVYELAVLSRRRAGWVATMLLTVRRKSAKGGVGVDEAGVAADEVDAFLMPHSTPWVMPVAPVPRRAAAI